MDLHQLQAEFDAEASLRGKVRALRKAARAMGQPDPLSPQALIGIGVAWLLFTIIAGMLP